MKESIKKNRVNIISWALLTVIIICSLLKLTGTFDVVDAMIPDKYKLINSPYNETKVIDEWRSESYGKLGAYVKIVSKDNGYIYITNTCSQGKGFEKTYNYCENKPNKSIENETYDFKMLENFGEDEENNEFYSYIVAPLDCEYMMVNDTKLEPQIGSIRMKDKTVTFKIFTLTTPMNNDFKYSRLEMIDEKGEAHFIQQGGI